LRQEMELTQPVNGCPEKQIPLNGLGDASHEGGVTRGGRGQKKQEVYGRAK